MSHGVSAGGRRASPAGQRRARSARSLLGRPAATAPAQSAPRPNGARPPRARPGAGRTPPRPLAAARRAPPRPLAAARRARQSPWGGGGAGAGPAARGGSGERVGRAGGPGWEGAGAGAEPGHGRVLSSLCLGQTELWSLQLSQRQRDGESERKTSAAGLCRAVRRSPSRPCGARSRPRRPKQRGPGVDTNEAAKRRRSALKGHRSSQAHV